MICDPQSARGTSEAEFAQGDPAAMASPWHDGGKRALDLLLASILLVLTAPLVVLAAVVVKLTSSGPVIYSQTRSGRGAKPFTLRKIRSMYHECERHSGPQWSLPGDPRVTPVGRFLRLTHIDELPQLWNVLKGEMSLVGPRPERPVFVEQLESAFPNYQGRLAVRPGVTGLAQVQLPPDTEFESVRRKLAYDLYYVNAATLKLDLLLIAATAIAMVGIPFPVTNWLLRLPSAAEVEGGADRPRPVSSGCEDAAVDVDVEMGSQVIPV